MSQRDIDQRPDWPPPRPDPDREPSHPGAFLDHRDDGWWERWLDERNGESGPPWR